MANLNFGNLSFYRNKKYNDYGQCEIYIRYTYTDPKTKKAERTTKKTNVLLTESEFIKLTKNKLKGEDADKLYEIYDNLETALNALYLTNQTYGIDFFKSLNLNGGFEEPINSSDTFQLWFDEFLLGTKKSTGTQYRYNLEHFKNFLLLSDLNDSKGNLMQVLNENIIYDYKQYIIRFNPEQTYNNMIKKLTTAKRFVNTIMKYKKLPLITTEIGTLKNDKEQLTLTKEEVEILETFDIDSQPDDNKLFKGNTRIRKEIYKQIQSIIRVNSLLGIRISDVKNLKKEHITFLDGVTAIRLYDTKGNSSFRDVGIPNKYVPEFIQELKIRCENCNENGNLWYGDFLDKTSNLNQYLKDYAELCELNRDFEYYNYYCNGDVISQKNKVYKEITTHTFRRYGINNNLIRFNGNAKLTQQLSGHKSMEVMLKHYTRDSTIKEQVEIWKNAYENK